MDEPIELLDADGKPTGERCLKSEAHRMGYLHATVHVWFYTKNLEVLIQKRKASKDTFPGLWDVSVAGHIPFGESPKEGAVREVSEEIGLTIDKNDLLFFDNFDEKHIHASNFIDNERHHVFFCELKVPLEKLTAQPEEVEEIKLIPLNRLATILEKESKTFVPHSKSYYNSILRELKARSKPF